MKEIHMSHYLEDALDRRKRVTGISVIAVSFVSITLLTAGLMKEIYMNTI